jgi:putative toxin-antitoxin system antitoxin component (TIGR02293 family)
MTATGDSAVAHDKGKTAPKAPARKTASKKTKAAQAPAARKPAAAALRTTAAVVPQGGAAVMYRPGRGVDDFVRQVSAATPLQLVEIERRGVAGSFLKDLSRRMDIPAARVFSMLGVPKATAEKKASAGEVVAGSGGQAALGVARLIAIAQAIVANSTAKQAQGFDAARWLGQWLERPQPSLGGRRPAELIDTPTGIDVVARLLGAIESGSYQ